MNKVPAQVNRRLTISFIIHQKIKTPSTMQWMMVAQ